MHSRANCAGFNESISWEYRRSYRLATRSIHTNPKASYSCNVGTQWETTWRSAVVHYAEGYGGWTVRGNHWTKDGDMEVLMKITEATDCNIYDGWWDV